VLAHVCVQVGLRLHTAGSMMSMELRCKIKESDREKEKGMKEQNKKSRESFSLSVLSQFSNTDTDVCVHASILDYRLKSLHSKRKKIKKKKDGSLRPRRQ
jgi:hypothetical protein